MADKLITEEAAKELRRLLVRMANELLETPSTSIIVLPKSEVELLHHMIDRLAELPDAKDFAEVGEVERPANRNLALCIEKTQDTLQRCVHLMLTQSGPVPTSTIGEIERDMQVARGAFEAYRAQGGAANG